MNVPAELRYTKDHEWVRKEGDNAVIGITEFAAGELGDIVFVDISTEGQELEAEAVFGTVEAVKTVRDHPEAVNEDPYGKGWMVKVKMADAAAFDQLLTADAYKELVGG